MAVFTTFGELPSTGLRLGWGGTIREDLQDFITNVSPQEVPLLAGLQQVKVQSYHVEWIEDELPARGLNAVNEGIAFTETTISLGVRRHTTVQTFYQAGLISDGERDAAHAAIGDPFVYAEHKAFLSLRGDIEHALHRGSEVTGAVSTPRQFNGLLNAFPSGVTKTSAFSLGASSGAGEAAFNTILEIMYQMGDLQPAELYCNSRVKRKISAFNTRSTFNLNAEDKRQVLTTDVYVSDFGTTRLYLSRDQLQASNLCSWVVIDPRYLATGWYSPVRRETLSRDGLRDRFQISAALTLIPKSSKACVGAIEEEV